MNHSNAAAHTFSQIPKADIQRSVFNRSHGHKTTFSSGYLIPFFVDECLPGDTFSGKTTFFARLATPIVPCMDNLYLDYFYFAVPYRILWDNFKKMMGEQVNPGDTTSYTIPQVSSPNGGFPAETLGDYFGLPISPHGASAILVNALPFRAYSRIWQDWFRDENLQNSPTIYTDDATHNATDYPLQKRGKRHDYFTSCLPWAQKGINVTIPLGLTAPVYGNGSLSLTDGSVAYGLNSNSTAINHLEASIEAYNQAPGTTITPATYPATHLAIGVPPKVPGVISGLYADLSTASAATINLVRYAFQLQKLIERDARGGTRYIEIVKSHFGVTAPDFRMQRPEYLGGGSSRFVVSPVQQTSSTDTTSPQGNLAAYGINSHMGNGFHHSFTEHCVIMGLCMVRTDISYQQGLPRMWTRKSRYEHYWPVLANLGEQEVYNKEIYWQGNPTFDDAIFGYQERWAEYRYFPSKITGRFRSTDPLTLDIWHLAQNFGALPTLGATFIEETPPIQSRLMAVKWLNPPTNTISAPEFLLDTYTELRCARPMPTYSVPGLIDHF